MFEARHAPYAVSPEVEALLVRHYSEPHRAYHNLTHIAELLRWFDIVADDIGWTSPRDVYDAILFHDVIYDPTASDNEARSADLALAHGCSQRTAELIKLTALHGKISRDGLVPFTRERGDPDFNEDAPLFLDCDTAILGAAPEAFDAYDRAIMIEYAMILPERYREGRYTFLWMMQQRHRLFLTDYFHAKLDAAARANIARTIVRYPAPMRAGSS